MRANVANHGINGSIERLLSRATVPISGRYGAQIKGTIKLRKLHKRGANAGRNTISPEKIFSTNPTGLSVSLSILLYNLYTIYVYNSHS